MGLGTPRRDHPAANTEAPVQHRDGDHVTDLVYLRGNGQATLLIAGLMMLAVALASRKEWWCSAACLLLATAFKPVTLPLLVLSAVVYRPFLDDS